MRYIPGTIALTFLIIRLLIKFSTSKSYSSTVKEYNISSKIEVDSAVISRLGIKSGEAVLLKVRPESNIVEVNYNMGAGNFETIGTIQDTELAIKVEGSKARATIGAVHPDAVVVDLVYR